MEFLINLGLNSLFAFVIIGGIYWFLYRRAKNAPVEQTAVIEGNGNTISQVTTTQDGRRITTSEGKRTVEYVRRAPPPSYSPSRSSYSSDTRNEDTTLQTAIAMGYMTGAFDSPTPSRSDDCASHDYSSPSSSYDSGSSSSYDSGSSSYCSSD